MSTLHILRFLYSGSRCSEVQETPSSEVLLGGNCRSDFSVPQGGGYDLPHVMRIRYVYFCDS